MRTSKVIDGFVSRPSKTKAPLGHGRIKSAEIHDRAQKARTLMRGGLKRPTAPQQPYPQHHSARTKIGTQLRAKTVGKHSRVEHFGHPISSAGADNQALSGEIINPGRTAKPSGAATTKPLPSMVASASHQKLERLLDEALTRADAHKEALKYQAARHFWQRRWFSGPGRWVFSSVVLVLLLGGLTYAWRTMPQLSIKVAAMRAHMSAAVPAYKPDGFSVAGPAKAESGAIVLTYKSGIDQAKTYDITEQQSNFTSTMVSQSVVPKGAPVQTSQVEGNTVYIYGNSNDAAWVNNGVLYTIKNHSGLSSDQLIQIVSGINP